VPLSSEPPGGSLVDGFLASAARCGDRPALRIAGVEHTYQDLLGAASRYAAALHRAGVGRGDRVGLMLDKSRSLYASLLGTLMTGAAYVPLAPAYPVERLRLIIEQAALAAVIRSRHTTVGAGEDWMPASLLASEDIDAAPGELFTPVGVDAVDPAYVLFTSGSTGTPKGVVVSNGNAAAFVSWAADFCELGPDDRLSGHSDLNFDLSVFDVFGAWKRGCCLVPVIDMLDRATPSAFIAANQITIWFSVPSVLSTMLATSDLRPERLQSIRFALFCGEPLLPGPVRALMQACPQVRVANLYGPTEATVACSAYELTAPPPADAESIPIGWRTRDTEVFVWHEDGRVAAIGESGEILIAGDQVALGYWRRDDETRQRFIADPRGTGKRCYRTGDVGVVGAQGPVFKGRLDNQVKFRGWRIELGDIEHHLAAQEGVVECAVALISREGKTDALAAFLRMSSPRPAKAIVSELRAQLPDYMIPTHVRIVTDFPRTLNGKIDRKQLSGLL
jgi:amino acid adenylation domain-containing protein